MIHVETEEYFSLNRILLLAIGLWPYQQSSFTRIQFIILSIILTTNIIFQCTIFVSQKCTPDLITKVLSSVFFFIVFTIKYNLFYLKIEIIKDILGQLLHACNKLKDPNEIAIINEYGCNAKRYTVALTIFAVCGVSAFIIASFWSDIFNVILSTNVSRSHKMLIMTEHFINQEKYFYLILLHTIASVCIGATAMLAIGAMFITYLQHTCGMFKIARLSTLLLSNCQVMMFCLIVFGVGCMSVSLFHIISSGENVKELVISIQYSIVAILYMFLANYIGQTITNHNHHVFVTAYNVQWYIAPLYIQRIILFLLQKNSRNFTLNIGGMFVASIECFATLVKTSVSYFTFMYSAQ